MRAQVVRHITDDERRARLAVRHALAPSAHARSVDEVARALTVLHATDPATVYLTCWARTCAITIADIDRAFYAERTLVKQLAMRRTLFAFPRDLLPAAWGSAAARVAKFQRARMAPDLVAAGLAHDGGAWLDRVGAEILAVLEEHPEGLAVRDLRRLVPSVDLQVIGSTSEQWSTPRVLTYLGARGEILRGAGDGPWRAPRQRWTLTRHWLGTDAEPRAAADGYRELVQRWLYSFGPGTEEDLVWWLGATRAVVRAALDGVGAVPVRLDGGDEGWLLPGDREAVKAPEAWVSLLPVLDPTVMGWKGRSFYLGPHREQLFDRAGNAGTTVWADGRVVGCWVQDGAGTVEVRLLEAVSAGTRRALEREAVRLSGWLGGVRLNSALRSPAMTPGADEGGR